MRKLAFICVLLPVFTLASCTKKSEEVKVFVIKGPSGVGLVRLFDKDKNAEPYKISPELVSQADVMASRFISGDADVGILPVNVAAKIASQGGKVKLAAITGEGMLSLLTDDENCAALEDLRGREVYCSGQGAVPEYVFRRILAAKGIIAGENIKLNFSLAYPETAQSIIAGKIHYALLPEPFASLALAGNPEIRAVGDIQKEWAALIAESSEKVSNYPMTALVVNSNFASKNKEALDYVASRARVSIEWVIANPKEAAVLAEENNLGLKAAVIERAIPKSNYVYTEAKDARPEIEALLRAFLEFAPDSIGGRLPLPDFYL